MRAVTGRPTRPARSGRPSSHSPRLALAALLVAAALQPACLMRSTRPGAPPLVGEVKIEGNTALEDRDITRKLALTESGFYFVVERLSIGAAYPFEADTLQSDARRIERLYQANGYFDARVTDIRTREKNGRIDITFVVQEGEPTRVVQQDITGLDELPDELRQTVAGRLPLKPGDVFSESGWDSTKERLRERLRARGYMEATVEGQVVVDRQAHEARLELNATPGLRYTVKGLFVYGAQSISRSRIMDATQIEDGQLLTPQLLAEAQRRVYSLGVFGLVRVELGPFNRVQSTVPVVVTVTEAPSRTLEVGGGIQLDPARNLARVRTEYIDRNVARGLQRLTLGASVGYAVVPGLLSFFGEELIDHGLVLDARAEYVQPRVFRSPVDVLFALDYTKDLTPAFRYQRAGVRAGAPIHFDRIRGLSLVPSLNFEWYFDIGVRGGLTGQTNQLETAGCSPTGSGSLDDQCRTFYGELRATYDLRDDPLSTHQGILLDLSLQAAGNPLGGEILSDFSYLRIAPEVRGFYSPSRRWTFGARARIGLLYDLGGSRQPPGIARFFAGGANSVRAVGTQQLGPRRFVVTVDDDDELVAGAPIPLGGNRLFELSGEVRWRTPIEHLYLTVFVDAGSVWFDSEGVSTAPDLLIGPGFGVRYQTPFGPLRLDLATALTRRFQVPAAVEVPSELPAGQPTPSTNPADYSFRRQCPSGAGFTCFQDGTFYGVQLFITLGEAF